MGARYTRAPRLFVLPLLAALAWASLSSAQTDDSADPAQVLYREGAALAADGKWSEAAQKFEAAVAIRATPVGLFNLAQAERNLGLLAAAKRHFVSARSLALRDGAEDIMRLADDGLGAVNPRVPKIQLHLPPDAAQVSAEIDGRPVEIVGDVIEADPGRRKLVITASGERPFSQMLELREGTTQSVRVDFPKPERPAPPPAPTPIPKPVPIAETHAFGPPLGAIVLGGTGALALAAGAYFHIRRNDKLEDAADGCVRSGGGWRCPASYENDADHQELKDDAARAETVRNVLLGVGAGALVAGGLWWALGPSGKEKREPAVAVGFGATPSSASARVRIRL